MKCSVTVQLWPLLFTLHFSKGESPSGKPSHQREKEVGLRSSAVSILWLGMSTQASLEAGLTEGLFPRKEETALNQGAPEAFSRPLCHQVPIQLKTWACEWETIVRSALYSSSLKIILNYMAIPQKLKQNYQRGPAVPHFCISAP